MDIELIKAGFPERETHSLLKQRENVVAKIALGTADMGELALRAAIDDELEHRFPDPDEGWSPGRQGDPRFLRKNGRVCAIVIRLETHGATKGGYLIEVMGVALNAHPRNVDEARALAERHLSKFREI